jgi:hypothetical protein
MSKTRKRRAEDEGEQLWNELLKGKARSSEQARRAITYCRDFVDTYDKLYKDNEAKWFRWQRVMIIGGVVATLSGVVPEEWFKLFSETASFGWLRGVPAGLVTIAAGFLSSFTYKEDAVRHEVTSTAIYNELVKFLCKAAPYNNKNESDDISKLLNTVSQIVDTELETWSTQVITSTNLKPNAPTAHTDTA